MVLEGRVLALLLEALELVGLQPRALGVTRGWRLLRPQLLCPFGKRPLVTPLDSFLKDRNWKTNKTKGSHDLWLEGA